MGIRRLVIAVGMACVCFGGGARAEDQNLAEVRTDETLFRQFSFTQYKRRPFLDDGHWVNPNIAITVRPELGKSANSALTLLKVDVAGATNTTETQAVTRRRSVTVSVDASVRGNFSQDLFWDGTGLTPGSITGNSSITPRVSVSNNFRLLNALVNRKAHGIASATVAAQMPLKQAQFRGEVTGGLKSASDQAAESVGQVLAQTRTLLPSDLPGKVETRLSSTGKDGEVKAELIEKSGAAKRGPRPKLALENQAAVRSFVHEDIFAATLASEFAGKEMKLAQVMERICGPKSSRLLDFCRKDLPDDTKKMSIVFDKEKPIELSFREGKISLKLNALYRRLHRIPETNAGVALLQPPGSPKEAALETAPYTVEAVYQLKNGSAVLEGVTVRPRGNPPAPKGAADPKGTHGVADFFKSGRDLAGMALDHLTQKELEKNFRQAFKAKIEPAPVSFPTKGFSSDDGSGATITEAGTLFPLEMKAENGWLAVSTAYCSENTPPLGGTFSTVREREGGPISMQFTEVTPYSPAWNNYFKAGDRIESFGEPGQRATTLTSEAQPFFDFMQERAKGRDAASRTVELVGKDSDGRPFRRTLSLCPRGYDHRGEAERTARTVREAAGG